MINQAQARRTRSQKKKLLAATNFESLEQRRLLSVNVLSWHNDAGLTGLNPNEQTLTPANVNSASFGKLFSYAVTGQVYAQPLYVSNLNMGTQGTHNVVFVATMNNDVYAFDADSTTGPTGGLLWHVNLGPAAAVPSPYIGFRYGPDHDTTPLVGVTSTPVIDLASGTMYLDSFTNDIPGQDAYSHHIHALSLTTGADRVTPRLVTASVAGNGVGGNGSTVTFAANRQIQRAALTMHNGTLYVSYAAYADTDPYHGWILGFNPSTLNTVSIFNTTPNIDASGGDAAEGEGGIWQSGAGLASDGSSLYLETGNGDYNPTYGDYSDSVLRITTDTSTATAPNMNGWGLKVADYFTPYNEQTLADADADLGSAGAIALPDQPGTHPRELVAIGKQGIIYVLDRDSLGGHNNTTDNVIQKVSLGKGFWGSPAYFNSSLYYHAVNDVLKRYSLTNGLLSAAPAAQSTVNYPTWPGATPSISANGTANGIVWDVQFETGHQILHAYDATTLAELYNSAQNATRDQMGAGVKFITPTIANGHVYVGSSGAITIYGLIQPVTTPPVAPNALTTTATSAGVQLAWVDNADNENGFKIERSTDGVTFSQIDLVGVDTRGYTDSFVAPNTKYYYRVRATNAIGDSGYTAVASATTLPPTGALNIYHFDAASGTSAVDSASGNNGTLVGSTLPQWVAGTSGGSALSFSGSGTYNQPVTGPAVSVSSGLSSTLGSTSTLALWVNTTQVGTNSPWQSPAITGADQAVGNNDVMWGSIDANGRIGLYVGNAGGVYSTSRINDGQWHHVAMTRDSVSGRVQIFIDGMLNATAILDAGDKTTPFALIGALTVADTNGNRTGATYFNGKLDEVRIYNAVLAPGEIAGLARVPSAPVLQSVTAVAGPVVHLAFNSPSGFAESIRISRKVGINGTFTPIATVSGGATTYDDTNVVAGTAYYYKLEAIDAAGTSTASNVLGATPPIPRVIGMYTFYNRSSFDGQNGSSNLTDRTAIATDKQPLRPGQTASFANYTSYSRGLTGIIIDVADMGVLPRIDDFEFTVGNSSDLATWTQAPTPAFINTYPGRGVDGSTQITIIWNDNDIQNEWLSVKVLAQPHLGLANDVTFYFGNSIGDTGDSAADADVTSNDASRVASHAGSANVANLYDINRDGVVDSTDVSLVNSNLTASGGGLKLLSFGSAPTVANPASASPNPSNAKTTSLSTLGADAAGESSLTYTWTAIGTPPAPVSFSANGTNAAKTTVATFSKAGAYQLLVTIANAAEGGVTSLVTVTVSQVATGIAVTGTSSLPINTSATFAAVQLDQFGDPMATQPSFTWSVSSGAGTITNAGVFTSSRATGSVTITATAGGLTGSTGVSVADDALAWYRADGTGSATLADSSAYNQPATLTGAYSFGAGISGNALTLTGGYATLPTGVVGSYNDFTIATWVKVTTLQQWSRIFDFGSGTGIYMMLTPMADSGKLRFAITTGSNGAEQRVDGPAMVVNQWTHIAITQSGDTATMYVNGIAVASNDAITIHPTNMGPTTQNYIGKSQWPDPAFQGSLDDFRIYSRALTADQVAGLANTSIAVVTPAAAAQSPVTTKSTTLSVLGADPDGVESELTYTWSTIGPVPAPVTFSANGTNAAKNVTATFAAAGTYNFLVTITNAAGLSVTSSVSVVVTRTAAGVKVSAPVSTIDTGMTVPLTFGTVDQFGDPFGSSVAATWTVSNGAGTVSSAGVFAASGAAGAATITASAPGIASSSITLTIVNSKFAWYQADSATGNTLTDNSGNNRNGTTNGGHTWGAGIAGNAITLTGGYVGLPQGIVSTMDDFTISTWVKVTTLADWARIFDFGSSTTSYMFLTPSAGGTGALRFAIKTSGNGEQIINGPAMTENAWTHVAITLAGDVATLYVNGVAVGTNNAMTFHPSDLGNTTRNRIGDSQFAADPMFLGSIDDFRIYSRALSSDEVAQLALPTIVLPATAAAMPAGSLSTTLSTLASDVTRGESALTYTWSVVGTQPGTVMFGANGTNASKNTTVTFGTAGTYTLQVAVNANGSQPVYSTVTVTVGLARVTSATQVWQTSPNQLAFTFSSDVGAGVFSTSSLTVRRSDGALATVSSYTYDAATRTATFTLAPDTADGDYTATLAKGSTLSADGTLPFFILAGDANHNRTVNFDDLLIVAKNYNASGRTFAEGNVSGDSDGLVNFSDLLILAKHYGSGLTAAQPAASAVLATTTTTSTTRRRTTTAADVLPA